MTNQVLCKMTDLHFEYDRPLYYSVGFIPQTLINSCSIQKDLVYERGWAGVPASESIASQGWRPVQADRTDLIFKV